MLPSLINDLAALTEPIVLFLDDCHLISTPEIHDGVDFLLDHLPPATAAPPRAHRREVV